MSGIAQSYGSSMGGMRDCCSQGLWEKLHQQLIFACDAVNHYLGQTVTAGLVSCQGPAGCLATQKRC